MDYTTFKNNVLGKGFDIDGAYSFQCWDGYAQWCIANKVPYANCTQSGYVKDIWELRHSNGMLNHFDEVEVMQAGDVAVFKEYAGWTPVSHIALFDSDAGGGFGNFLGQNQSGNGSGYPFNIIKLPYVALYPTAFRLKGTPKQTGSAPASQSATSTIKQEETDMFTISAEGRGIALMTGGSFYALLDAKDPVAFWSKGVPHIQVSVATFDNFQTKSNVGKLDDSTVKKLIDGLKQ